MLVQECKVETYIANARMQGGGVHCKNNRGVGGSVAASIGGGGSKGGDSGDVHS